MKQNHQKIKKWKTFLKLIKENLKDIYGVIYEFKLARLKN